MYRLSVTLAQPVLNTQLNLNHKSEEMDEADESIEAMIEAARTKAFNEGIEQGKNEGVQQARDETSTLTRHLNRMFEEVVAQRGALLQEAETLIVKLVMAIARKVIRREVREHPDTIDLLVRDTLKYVVDRDTIIVKVNPKDLTVLEEMTKNMPISLKDVKKLEFVQDSLIEQGGCIIETNSGTIDATLETQFEEIESDLLDKAFDESL